MGAILSFVFWLFTDPIETRGQPHLYLPSKPALTVRTEGEEKTEVISLAEFVETRVSSLLEKYTPTWWLPNGHFQTIWCSLGDFTTVDHVPYTRDLLAVPDGGQMGLDWTQPQGEELDPKTPIIVVLHGLTGGSYEAYVRAILHKACRSKATGGLGYRGVVMNFRGCAGVPLTSPQMFSGGYTGDIRCALLYISALFPDAPLLGVGFSLGANVLSRYVGEEGEDSRLTAACVLACPWDNIKNSEQLENRWINKTIYSKAMGGTLIGLFNRNSETLASFKEPSAITPHLPILLSLKNPDFIDVNAHLTSIIGGSFPPFPFKTVHDYYDWASADKPLPGVRVPFLALNAKDDPIVAEVPVEQAGKNPWVAFAVTDKGGHLGWFVGGGFFGRGGPPVKWNQRPVLQWCKGIVEDFVDQRPNGAKGKARYEKDGFIMEEGSGPFVGYKVVSTGGHVEPVVPSKSMWAGL